MLHVVFVLRLVFHRWLSHRKLTIKKFQLRPALIKIIYDNRGGDDIDNTEWAVDLGGREDPSLSTDIIHDSRVSKHVDYTPLIRHGQSDGKLDAAHPNRRTDKEER